MNRTKSIAAAVSISIAGMCFPGISQADPWHDSYRWDRGYDDAGAAFFGLAAGLIIGGALAPRYYGYPRPYYDSGYYQPRYYRQPSYYNQPYYHAQPYGGPPQVIYEQAPGYYAAPAYAPPLYYAPYRQDPSYRSNR